jgi:hypothetical protein
MPSSVKSRVDFTAEAGMSRRIAFPAALIILGLTAPPGAWAQAQARPDLAGTWVLNYDKSGPEVRSSSRRAIVLLAGRRHGGRVSGNLDPARKRPVVKKTMTQEGESQTATAVYEKAA